MTKLDRFASSRRTLAGVKPNDAVQLGSAIWQSVDTFYTYDHEDLLPLSGILRCRDGKPLTVCKPPERPPQAKPRPTLFDAHAEKPLDEVPKLMKPGSPAQQSKRFVETARELGCDEDKGRFEEMLSKIAKAKGAPIDTKVKMKPEPRNKPKVR